MGVVKRLPFLLCFNYSTTKPMKSQKFGIKAKLIIALSGFSIIIVSLTGILAYQLSKNALEKQAFDQLTSIRETKKKAITDYFGTIKNQVVTLSHDLTVIESAKIFSQEFEYLDTNLTEVQKSTYLSSINNYYNDNFIGKLNSNIEGEEAVSIAGLPSLPDGFEALSMELTIRLKPQI